MKHWLLCVLVVPCCLEGAWAAARPAPPLTLTWDTLAVRALSGPAYLAAQARLRAAQAGVSETRQYPNPELTLWRGHTQAGAGLRRDPVWGVEVGLPLESLLLRRYRHRGAVAAAQAARWEVEAVRRAVLRDLRLLYVTVGHDQEVAAAHAATTEHLAHLVEAVQLRVTHGESRPVELVRVQAEQAEAQAEAQADAAEAAAHRELLALWLGADAGYDLRVDLALEALPSLSAAEEVRTRLRQGHPQLQAAQRAVAQAEARVGEARQVALPGLQLGGSYEREGTAPTYNGTLTVTVPLWNWNGGGLAVARAGREAARRDAEALTRQLEEEAIALHGRARGVQGAIAQYSERLLPNSQAVLSAVEQTYQAGETSLIDLLDARRQAVRTRAAYLDLLAEYHTLWTELNTLMGAVDDE